MQTVFRQSWLAVCLLFALCYGGSASAQVIRVVPADIIAAEDITADMRQKMIDMIDPTIKSLESADPEQVAAARKALVRPFRDTSATIEFKLAFSNLITARLGGSVSHKTVLVRMNAMIILASMTDEPSKELITAGMKDPVVAVQRKAVEALRGRVQQYLRLDPNNALAANGIPAAVNQINALLDQKVPPHPIVVMPAFKIFADINTTEALTDLVGHLNKRVALHAKTPGMPYDAEMYAIDQLSIVLFQAQPVPKELAKQSNRAAYRYSMLTVGHLQRGQIEEEDLVDTIDMLGTCVQAMGRISPALEGGTPPDQVQVASWLKGQDWGAMQKLVDADWKAILIAEPIKLTEEDLALPAAKPE